MTNNNSPRHATANKHATARIDCRGFSLVELMIAMVLGVIVIGGAIAAFGSTSRSTELNQSMSQLQANARFALDSISGDIRMAGFQGCASAESAQLSLSTTKAPFTNYSTSAIAATEVGIAEWENTLPPGYSPPSGNGAPIPGTHLLQVQYAAAPGYSLAEDMGGRSSEIAVNGNANDMVAGELAVISNCDTGDLFEVESIGGTANKRVVRAAESLTQAYIVNPLSANTTRVMPFVSTMYYIGDTGRVNEQGDQVRSLYLQTFPHNPASNPPLELIEGVDQLRLSFGLWQTDNSLRFVSPGDPALDTQNISMAHVGILMSTLSRHLGSRANRTHILAGQVLAPSGSSGAADGYYPDDKRIRVPFSSTVKVRNRFPENRG